MTLRNLGNPSGFSRLLTPFMSKAIRRANQRDLRRLKRALEPSETESRHMDGRFPLI